MPFTFNRSRLDNSERLFLENFPRQLQKRKRLIIILLTLLNHIFTASHYFSHDALAFVNLLMNESLKK